MGINVQVRARARLYANLANISWKKELQHVNHAQKAIRVKTLTRHLPLAKLELSQQRMDKKNVRVAHLKLSNC